jgi:prepilin-type N-terminal cleavage/methylation domain-containing protein
MRPDRVTKQAGFSLVEALVAMAILSISISGTVVTISNGQARLADVEHEQIARNTLHYRFELGQVGEGHLQLGPTDIDAVWSVERVPLRDGQLAGVYVQWETVHGQIVWLYRGRERRIELERVDMVAMTASP